MDEKTKKKRVEKRSVRKKKNLVEAWPEPKASATKKKKSNKKAKRDKNHGSPTYEQVQLRAYFISEQRRNVGVAGDEHSDWVRAERELRDELLAEKGSMRN
jgi:hypothetical protein